jgi:hypothetical protein
MVGAYAVIYHAQPRFTKDIDLFIKTDPANAKATYAALAAFGVPLQDIRPEDTSPSAAASFVLDANRMGSTFFPTFRVSTSRPPGEGALKA